MAWHTFRLPTRITEPSGIAGLDRVTHFTYDAQGNLIRRTLAAGALTRVWSWTYDEYGRVVAADGPRADAADITTFTYYPATDPCLGCRGQLHTVTNAAGHVTTYTGYDDNSRVTEWIDPNGVATRFTYDPRGRLLTRTDAADTPQAETTTFGYDAVGQITHITPPHGGTLRYTYDAAHRLIQLQDNAGQTLRYTLDAAGNRTAEQAFDGQNQLRRTQQRVFNALNRLVSTVGAYQETTHTSYDDNGNPIAMLDPAGALTTQVFDPRDRLITTVDAHHGATQYSHDSADQIIAVQDATGLTTHYEYDGLGDATGLTSPDTGPTRYTVDAAGHRIAQTNARGVTTTYAYDPLNRLTQAVAGAGATASPVSYSYDQGAQGLGRLGTISGGGGTLQYDYDALGRVTTQTETVAAQSLTIRYTHRNGLVDTITYPSGAVVAYGHDANGRIQELTVGLTRLLTDATYAPFGDVERFTFLGNHPVQRTQDLNGRIQQLTLGVTPHLPDAAPRTYGYDALNRLTDAALGPTRAYHYAHDAVGNRTQETTPDAVATYTYEPQTHRLATQTGPSPQTYGYDAAGHQTSRNATQFHYDSRGRLTGLTGGVTASYLVNGRGERVQKTTPAGATRFLYDPQGRLLGEYDGALNPLQEYVYLDDLLVGIIRTQNGIHTPYPVYADHLGAPRVVTDPIRPVDLWRWSLTGSAFGEHPPQSDPDGDGQAFTLNLRFPGQYYDAESGLHYNYYRDYDPTTGRYIQSDPIGLAGGINTYGYVGGNPLGYIDRLGLQQEAGLYTCLAGPNPVCGVFVFLTACKWAIVTSAGIIVATGIVMNAECDDNCENDGSSSSGGNTGNGPSSSVGGDNNSNSGDKPPHRNQARPSKHPITHNFQLIVKI
jgi:RHS repeat-associated protein